jgi:hypothetical protein
MRLTVIAILTLVNSSSFGQQKDSLATDEIICFFEPQPSYPGGFVEMNTFIKNELKISNGLQGS